MNHHTHTNTTPPALSQRETVVLAALARFRFLTARHIEAFLFQIETDIKPASRPVLTQRILKQLRTAGLVTRTERAVGGPGGGSGSFAHYLTKKGALALNQTSPVPSVQRTAPRGTFLMRHALAGADVALSFMTEAAQRPDHELLVWESDWEIAQRVGHELIIPDAFLIYGSESTEIHAFVEIDLGTAGSRFFQSKVDRYLKLYRSAIWQRSIEIWPVVLTVTPTATRSALLKRSTETVLRAEPQRDRLMQETEFAFTELERIVTEGPLASIWQLAGQDGHHQLLTDPQEDTHA